MLKAVGLEDYMELFVEHRVQGDVLFNLTEENLKEMEVATMLTRTRTLTLTRTPAPAPTRTRTRTRT